MSDQPHIPTCAAEEREMQDQAHRGSLLHVMAQTEGWAQILRPQLVERRDACIKALCQATDAHTIAQLQGAIGEQSYVLESVEFAIEQGRQAATCLDAARESQRAALVDAPVT